MELVSRTLVAYANAKYRIMITLEKLKDVVSATGISMPEAGIDPGKTFLENGIDSLDTMTLLLSIEDAIGIKFTEEEVEQIKSLDDVIETVKKRG